MVWQILLWSCAALFSGFVLVLVLPVRVQCTWQSDPAKHAMIHLRPFGGVFPAICVYDSSRKKTDNPKPPRRKHKKNRKTGGITLRSIALSDVVDLLTRFMHAFQIEVLQLDAEFGLGDPAETGQLYGQLTPLIYLSGPHVRLTPNFAETCLRGRALVHFRFTLVGLMWPFVRFGWRVLRPVR